MLWAWGPAWVYTKVGRFSVHVICLPKSIPADWIYAQIIVLLMMSSRSGFRQTTTENISPSYVS